MISIQCERGSILHPGPYGSRPQRSAVDAVGLAIARTQDAWSWKKITGALLMDVAAAFPSVARGRLLRQMREMRLGEGLVRWTDSFMREWGVVMSVDGQEGPPTEVTMGLPQGPPVSPVLFCIYISGAHEEVEERVPGARGISFVDDVTWFVEGESIEEVTRGFEDCVQESIRWAKRNAVRFEASKT